MAATAAQAASDQTGRQDRTGDTDPLTVRALARGLSILSLFDVDHREWTIDEIAARTGLLRMTAYRMVRTLEATEFLVRDTTTNQYHLGPAAIAMAYVAEDNSEFVEHTRPFLEELLEKTGESVTLAVPVDGVPVCVSIINTTRPFQRQVAPGRILGDLASVHGKIFAAFAPPERRAAVLARSGASTLRAPSPTPRPSSWSSSAWPTRTWRTTRRASTPAPAPSGRLCATSSATSWPRSPWSCRRAASARKSETSAPAP